jgi:hypothetical protein
LRPSNRLIRIEDFRRRIENDFPLLNREFTGFEIWAAGLILFSQAWKNVSLDNLFSEVFRYDKNPKISFTRTL